MRSKSSTVRQRCGCCELARLLSTSARQHSCIVSILDLFSPVLLKHIAEQAGESDVTAMSGASAQPVLRPVCSLPRCCTLLLYIVDRLARSLAHCACIKLLLPCCGLRILLFSFSPVETFRAEQAACVTQVDRHLHILMFCVSSTQNTALPLQADCNAHLNSIQPANSFKLLAKQRTCRVCCSLSCLKILSTWRSRWPAAQHQQVPKPHKTKDRLFIKTACCPPHARVRIIASLHRA